MSIKLDWQIETERIHQRATESPEARQERRQQRRKLILFTMLTVFFTGVTILLVLLRLEDVDNQLRQSLIDTIQAELTALRIGNYSDFMALQRSAGENWYIVQGERFQHYQRLKVERNLVLSGTVFDATVDGQRGRVVFEEVLDGVAHRAVWFYWRYSDGWRHVPSDYTFWGEARTLHNGNVTVFYRQLDEDTARVLLERAAHWWRDSCQVLGNSACPELVLEIVPNPVLQVTWDSARPNRLFVPSPLARDDRLPLSNPLPQALEETIAAYLAARQMDLVTGGMRPRRSADAAWLHQTLVEWLAATYTGRIDTLRLAFVQSLRDNYGNSAVAAVARALTPEADIGAVARALGQPLELLNLDWRPFFQWRLEVERQLIAQNDFEALQALWDVSDFGTRALLQQRINASGQPNAQVLAAAITAAADGIPRAIVQVLRADRVETLIFRLRNGTWKRSAT
ncbi:MAG: hypothetical protein RML95_07530 [Anaerolineae bacterium]|nr:hypothetical protein [Anaerolineae bacterium]